MKSSLFLLLALSAGALVSARVFHDDGVTGRSLSQVQLGASAFCPEGCDRPNGGCIQDNTMAGLRCQKCLGNLVVNKVNGNCTCPAGKYADAANRCTDCPKGSWCAGGDYSISTGLKPILNACPINMTTVGRRSTSNRACVQMPGFFYKIDAVTTEPSAELCPINSYSPGLKKQRACVPCPTGFITDPARPLTDVKTRPTDCLVPAGFYLKAPGQVAPCPMGEYKEGLGTGANCTKCAFGVTTFSEGSSSRNNCSVLMSGYYAAAVDGTIVTRTVICPQGFYCPGGAPNTSFVPTEARINGGRRLLQLDDFNDKINKCPGDAWTVEPGATSVEQCLVPPGYYYNGTTTLKCPAGSYRADWLAAAQPAAQVCISCGEGVKAATTDQVKAYNSTDSTLTWFEPVTSSADDCYIMPGQGLYYTSTTATWRARNCASNNYGVANTTFGLTPAPCRDCPQNMVAIYGNSTYPVSNSFFTNNTDGTFGFTNVLACVNQDGYGYNGRVSQLCEKGYYNKRDNRADCTACSYGLTTAAVGAGVVEGDCGIAPGFGYDGATIRECPMGTYNNDTIDSNRQAACTACTTGTTTQGTGSSSPDQCNLCAIGYGGPMCATPCGGDVTDSSAVYPGTYGQLGRSWSSVAAEENPNCTICTTQATGYSFSWQFTNDNYPVPAISPMFANASTDCLAKYSQTFDGAWYMPTTGSGSSWNTTANIANFSACVDLCDDYTNSEGGACQWLTYDYVSKNCTLRVIIKQVYVGAPVVGFKAVPSGDVGTNAWSEARSKQIEELKDKGVDEAEAKALASGRYTFYQDEFGLEIGNWTATIDGLETRGQRPAPNAGTFTRWQDCLNACDDDHACTAFIIRLKVVVAERPSTCLLVYGRQDVGEFKRTFVRADISRLSDISGSLK